MTVIDWGVYNACPVCSSLQGEPCLSKRGLLAGEGPVEVPRAEPHSSRPMSKVASRA